MSRSFKKHPMLYWGYFGRPAKKHKLHNKLDVKSGSNCSDPYDFDYFDEIPASCCGFYKRLEGMTVHDATCVIALTLPQNSHQRFSIPANVRRKLSLEFSTPDFLVAK